MSAETEELSDVELAATEFLGTPEGAAMAFEVGAERTIQVWIAGYKTGTDHIYMEQLDRIENLTKQTA